MIRRMLLGAALALAAMPAMAQPRAPGTDYPNRPVRIVVALAPGGNADINARLVATALSQRLGQQFVVENRPSGGGTVAFETVAQTPPDGYTLLVGALGSHTLNVGLVWRPAAGASADRRGPHHHLQPFGDRAGGEQQFPGAHPGGIPHAPGGKSRPLRLRVIGQRHHRAHRRGADAAPDGRAGAARALSRLGRRLPGPAGGADLLPGGHHLLRHRADPLGPGARAGDRDAASVRR